MPPPADVRRLKRRAEGLVKKGYALFDVTGGSVDIAVIIEARPGNQLPDKNKALIFRSSESYFPRVKDLLRSNQTKSQVPFDFQTLREAQVNGVHDNDKEISDGGSSDISSVAPRRRSRHRKLERGLQQSHQEDNQHMAESEPREHGEPDVEPRSAQRTVPISPCGAPILDIFHAAEPDMLQEGHHGDFGDVGAWGLGFKIDSPVSHQQTLLRHGEDLDADLVPHNVLSVFAETAPDSETTVPVSETHQERDASRFTTPPPHQSSQKIASQPVRYTSDRSPDAWRFLVNEDVSIGVSSRALQASSPSPAQRFRQRQQIGLSTPTSHGPSFRQKGTARPARLESLSVNGPLRRGVQVNKHRIARRFI